MKTIKIFKLWFFVFFSFIFYVFPQNNFSYDEESSVYLLDYAKVEVDSNFKSKTLIHQKIKIIGQKGKRFAELRIPYDADRQKVKIISALTITPEGKILKATKENIKIVTPAELTEYTALYPGVKTICVNLPGVEIGSTVEYKYEIYTSRPLINGHFYDGFYFQSVEPFLISKYELKIPKKIKIFIYEEGIKLKEKKESSAYTTYIWENNNANPIIEEPFMPPLYEIVPRVYITTFNSWEEIGKWYYNLSKDCSKPDENIIKKVNELIEDKKTEEEKISAIYNFVCQKIRYVGVELGPYGFKPHDAKDVFHLKYGDCKDKANLMKTMLEIAGIKSYITLVNTDGKIEKDIPFPGQFNHAIVAIENNNNFLFLDPTSEVYRFPQIPPSDQNKYVLISKPGLPLEKTPLFAPEENYIKRKINTTLYENGDILSNVEIETNGLYDAIFRSSFIYLKDIERQRALSSELNSILPGTNLISFEIEGIENLEKNVIEKYSFKTNSFATVIAEHKIIFTPGIIDTLKDTSIVSLEKRNFPLRFGYLFKKEEIVIYTLPENFKVEILPSPIEIDNNFATFKYEIKENDGKIYYRRIFEIKKDEITIDEYNDFRNFYRTVSKIDRLPVILTKIEWFIFTFFKWVFHFHLKRTRWKKHNWKN